MEALFTAIKALFDGAAGAATRALAPGGIWFGTAPEGTALPLVAVNLIAGETLYTMGTKYIRYAVQFSIFDQADTPLATMRVYDALIALYDDNAIAITGWRIADRERRGAVASPEPDNDGWAVHVDYEWTVGAA